MFFTAPKIIVIGVLYPSLALFFYLPGKWALRIFSRQCGNEVVHHPFDGNSHLQKQVADGRQSVVMQHWVASSSCNNFIKHKRPPSVLQGTGHTILTPLVDSLLVLLVKPAILMAHHTVMLTATTTGFRSGLMRWNSEIRIKILSHHTCAETAHKIPFHNLDVPHSLHTFANSHATKFAKLWFYGHQPQGSIAPQTSLQMVWMRLTPSQHFPY